MIKCPKCGTDNLLTAIFCRGCGDKLDFDALKPEDFENTESNAKQKQSELANRIAAYVLIALGTIFLLSVICPAFGKLSPCDPADISKSLTDKYELVVSQAATDKGVSFSSQDLTDLLNWRLSQYSGSLGNPALKAISVKVNTANDGYFDVVASISMSGFPLSVSMPVLPSGREGNIGFYAPSMKVGLVPVPASIQDQLGSSFRTVWTNLLMELSSDINTISFHDDTLKIVQVLPTKNKKKNKK